LEAAANYALDLLYRLNNPVVNVVFIRSLAVNRINQTHLGRLKRWKKHDQSTKYHNERSEIFVNIFEWLRRVRLTSIMIIFYVNTPLQYHRVNARDLYKSPRVDFYRFFRMLRYKIRFKVIFTLYVKWKGIGNRAPSNTILYCTALVENGYFYSQKRTYEFNFEKRQSEKPSRKMFCTTE